jgi:copper chaperone CopZ
LAGCQDRAVNSPQSEPAVPAEPASFNLVGAPTIALSIPNMHCESCAKKIRSRLFTVKGVSRVVTWLQHDLAVIEPVKGQSVSSKAIWDALEQGKFEVDRIETPQGVIAKKPEA